MEDSVPDKSNRLAVLISIIFHPYVVLLPPVWLVFGAEGLVWGGLFIGIVAVPVGLTILILRNRNRHAYQRAARTPIFIVGWLCTFLCLFVAEVLLAPPEIIGGIRVILLWTPLQFLINSTITKASIHASMVAIAFTGLWILGYFDSILLLLISIVIIALVSWSRMVTKNHTLPQILLGLATGVLSVLIVLP